MVKELTASVHVFRRDPAGGWVTALVRHPRLGCWLPAATSKETRPPRSAASGRPSEETGLGVTLVPGPAAPAPAGFPHQMGPRPGWSPEGPLARAGSAGYGE